MQNAQRASEIRGKTMLFTWTDGPTKGKTYEHVVGFASDAKDWYPVKGTFEVVT